MYKSRGESEHLADSGHFRSRPTRKAGNRLVGSADLPPFPLTSANHERRSENELRQLPWSSSSAAKAKAPTPERTRRGLPACLPACLPLLASLISLSLSLFDPIAAPRRAKRSRRNGGNDDGARRKAAQNRRDAATSVGWRWSVGRPGEAPSSPSSQTPFSFQGYCRSASRPPSPARVRGRTEGGTPRRVRTDGPTTTAAVAGSGPSPHTTNRASRDDGAPSVRVGGCCPVLCSARGLGRILRRRRLCNSLTRRCAKADAGPTAKRSTARAGTST
jgi:hypothetical protein